jgi:hypothetical protein
MKNEKPKTRESLWVYYKMSTGETRATLRSYVGDSCTYVDDKPTTDLSATIYKAWIEKHGWLEYPKFLFLPRGIYVNDGSGCGFGENSERDASYHLVNELQYRRIMESNGYTFCQSVSRKLKLWWWRLKRNVSAIFDHIVHPFGKREFCPGNGANDIPLPSAPVDAPEVEKHILEKDA